MGLGTLNTCPEIRKSGNPGEPAGRSVYGLSEESLVHHGTVVPSAVVLAHRDEFGRLTPQALPKAVLGGDPCLDRILASRAHRERHRAALGARPDTTIVAVCSTWGPKSLLGKR